MPKVKISEYSATANSNTDVASINIDEGCAPSGINNAIRAIMGHLKDFQQGTNGDPFNGPVNGTVGATTPSTGAFTTLTASGNVGIGGTTNSYGSQTTLTLSGTNVSRIDFRSNSTFTGTILSYQSVTEGLRLQTEAGYPITFYPAGTEAMRLTSTSLYTASTINVGIGISNPTYKLQVANYMALGTQASAGAGAGINMIPSSTLTNWFVGANYVNSGTFQIIPSTAGGGSTFTTPALTIDSSSNVGIGTTSPTGISGYTALKINNATNGAIIDLAQADTMRGRLVATSGSFALETSGSIPIVFSTGGSEDARIDSSGNLRLGLTGAAYSAERLTVFKSGNVEAAAFVNDAGANNYTVAVSNRGTTGDNKFIVFATETSDTTRGSIVYNRAAGLTTYSTTSDYRAKDISGPVTGSGALIDSIPVYMGKMKWATEERPMFIAHETPAYAHTGGKDAVDADGKPVYQQMDASALIPVMWAEIQSLRKRLAAAGI